MNGDLCVPHCCSYLDVFCIGNKEYFWMKLMLILLLMELLGCVCIGKWLVFYVYCLLEVFGCVLYRNHKGLFFEKFDVDLDVDRRMGMLWLFGCILYGDHKGLFWK